MEKNTLTAKPNSLVTVKVKSLASSMTIIINGSIFLATAFISIMDILTGANVLEPIVSTFTKDPAAVTDVVLKLSQVYSLINILLRIKTKQPVTIK